MSRNSAILTEPLSLADGYAYVNLSWCHTVIPVLATNARSKRVQLHFCDHLLSGSCTSTWHDVPNSFDCVMPLKATQSMRNICLYETMPILARHEPSRLYDRLNSCADRQWARRKMPGRLGTIIHEYTGTYYLVPFKCYPSGPKGIIWSPLTTLRLSVTCPKSPHSNPPSSMILL